MESAVVADVGSGMDAGRQRRQGPRLPRDVELQELTAGKPSSPSLHRKWAEEVEVGEEANGGEASGAWDGDDSEAGRQQNGRARRKTSAASRLFRRWLRDRSSGQNGQGGRAQGSLYEVEGDDKDGDASVQAGSGSVNTNRMQAGGQNGERYESHRSEMT